MPEASSLSRYFPVVAVTPLSSATAESTVGRTCPHSLSTHPRETAGEHSALVKHGVGRTASILESP